MISIKSEDVGRESGCVLRRTETDSVFGVLSHRGAGKRTATSHATLQHRAAAQHSKAHDRGEGTPQ
jgi:hypothetical protein